MRKSIFVIVGIVFCALMLLTSCSMHRPVSQPSGSAFQLNMDRNDYKILGVGTGSACETRIIGIPIGGKVAYQEAVNQAVSSKNGDLLLQTSTDMKISYFPFTIFALWEEECINIQGVVVKFK